MVVWIFFANVKKIIWVFPSIFRKKKIIFVCLKKKCWTSTSKVSQVFFWIFNLQCFKYVFPPKSLRKLDKWLINVFLPTYHTMSLKWLFDITFHPTFGKKITKWTPHVSFFNLNYILGFFFFNWGIRAPCNHFMFLWHLGRKLSSGCPMLSLQEIITFQKVEFD